jgi:hypothetical protein
VRKLTKRLGAARVGEVVAAMRAGDFSAVAVAMLHYYDKLYDAHLANHGGTGSGGGSRAGRLVEVAPADPAAAFDADELAGLVLRRVREAEKAEEAEEAEAEEAGRAGVVPGGCEGVIAGSGVDWGAVVLIGALAAACMAERLLRRS